MMLCMETTASLPGRWQPADEMASETGLTAEGYVDGNEVYDLVLVDDDGRDVTDDIGLAAALPVARRALVDAANAMRDAAYDAAMSCRRRTNDCGCTTCR